MTGKIFLFLFLSLWASLSGAVDIVYRADSRAPSDIKKAGGFLAKGVSKVGAVAPDTSLWNHVNGDPSSGASKANDGYVSTSTDLQLATSWVGGLPGHKGYVYHIHVAPNMIDCHEILKQYNPFPEEKEYAALGSIPYNQIIGWSKVTNGKADKMEKNKAYNQNLYKRSTPATGQYQLAAFPPGHRAWSESPWKAYATCSNPKIRAARGLVGRATCKPKKSNVEYAQEYAKTMYT